MYVDHAFTICVRFAQYVAHLRFKLQQSLWHVLSYNYGCRADYGNSIYEEITYSLTSQLQSNLSNKTFIKSMLGNSLSEGVNHWSKSVWTATDYCVMFTQYIGLLCHFNRLFFLGQILQEIIHYTVNTVTYAVYHESFTLWWVSCFGRFVFECNEAWSNDEQVSGWTDNSSDMTQRSWMTCEWAVNELWMSCEWPLNELRMSCEWAVNEHSTFKWRFRKLQSTVTIL